MKSLLSLYASAALAFAACGPTNSHSNGGGGQITGGSNGTSGSHVAGSTGSTSSTGPVATSTSAAASSTGTSEGPSSTTSAAASSSGTSDGSGASSVSTTASSSSSGSSGGWHHGSSSSSTTTGTSGASSTGTMTTGAGGATSNTTSTASSTTGTSASSTTSSGTTASSTTSSGTTASSTTSSGTTASSTTTGTSATTSSTASSTTSSGTTASSTTTGSSASSTTGGGTTSGSTGGTGTSTGWLHTSGNHIYTDANAVWHARGANISDTRGCNACAYNTPDVNEVIRRIDELTDNWHANFMRLDMESYASAGGRVTWADVLQDPEYLSDIQTIVAHIESKQNVYIMLSLWVDPTFTSAGWPTSGTDDEWTLIAQTFKDDPHVLFGLVNEPQNNSDGSQDSQVWTAMNTAVGKIRAVEDAAGTPHHIVAVQGTGNWARRLGYYVTHPIAADNGDNVAYEVHVYDPQANFQSEWVTPAQTLPVIIGEFGPVAGTMSTSDVAALMNQAEQLQVPYLAWTFHMRCDPNLLVDNSGGGCGVGMTLQPTAWGTQLKNQLAQPY